jgi:hypothetical protein
MGLGPTQSPFPVILSAEKNLTLPAQGKLHEGCRSEYFQGNARFFVTAAPQNASPFEFFRKLRGARDSETIRFTL